MRVLIALLGVFACLLATGFTVAQPPGGGRQRGPSPPDAATFIAKMMSFDANSDGKLTKAEVTDERLQSPFERINSNNDGVATKDEITTFFTKQSANLGAADGGGPPGGPGGFGPPGGGNRPGGFGGPPQPGQVMPAFMQDLLQLTDSQKKQLVKLQQDVDARLAKILNDAQKQRLSEMRDSGPGSFGPPGGFGNDPGGLPRGPGGRNGAPQP